MSSLESSSAELSNPPLSRPEPSNPPPSSPELNGPAASRPDAPQSPAAISALRDDIRRALIHASAKDYAAAGPRDWMVALARLARNRLAERWVAHRTDDRERHDKTVNYLSMEFLVGRMLRSALDALNLTPAVAQLMDESELSLADALETETDAGLGNGGLGRLAACYMESLAECNIPSVGYGIRYQFGLFEQRIKDGHQIERPDLWLAVGSPWEFPRLDISYDVHFKGRVEHGEDGAAWVDTEPVRAIAFDFFVPGYRSNAVSLLRLWSANPATEIDLGKFNRGDFIPAMEEQLSSSALSSVLYPNDSTPTGQELRLKQEYFFSSASLQDILRRALIRDRDLRRLPELMAIHLNDTHPALSIPELMRLLIDEHQLSWDAAWAICERTFSYTNHTLMQEALEVWPVNLLERLLPRVLEIIYEINARLLRRVSASRPGDDALLSRLSIIDETHGRRVRMANLSIAASHRINGVSRLHSGIVRERLFADFAAIYPERFVNVTNGITPRRWLLGANPALSRLLNECIGSGWHKDLNQLVCFAEFADDSSVHERLAAVKQENKQRLADSLRARHGLDMEPDWLLDVQIKRIHEYKRQLLNLLYCVHRYLCIKAEPKQDWQARTVLFAGKAAPGYHAAKCIIKAINATAEVINQDPDTCRRLRLLFVPNYSVSLAEVIIPAAELSEQISMAGTEASGTGNMKLALNGALTIGTEDGANIEISEAAGRENIFLFGHTAASLKELNAGHYDPYRYYRDTPGAAAALDALRSGFDGSKHSDELREATSLLLEAGDSYRVLADFQAYAKTQARVDALYADPAAWQRMAVHNIANMGFFSSDRAVAEYAREIWAVNARDETAK